MHLSISDASGDSAIFEYIDGKLVIHHGKQYQVMTNSPTHDQQLSLAKYWENIGGATMLPGANRASDRFARMSYYINEATQTADPRRSVATVFSVMRNVNVPLGIKVPGQVVRVPGAARLSDVARAPLILAYRMDRSMTTDLSATMDALGRQGRRP